MKLYGGIDLHSNNNYLGIINRKDKKVYKKKLPNDLAEVLARVWNTSQMATVTMPVWKSVRLKLR